MFEVALEKMLSSDGRASVKDFSLLRERKPCVGWLVRVKAFARLNMYMKTF